MKLVFFFLASSALFTVAAIPMLSFGNPSAPSASSEPLDPNHVPEVRFGRRPTSENDRAATKDMIIDHYKGLEQGNVHKEARLAYVHSRWFDGVGPDDDHRQYLNFDYHRGVNPNSVKIGQTVTIFRDRPPPGPHFSNAVPKEHKPEIAKEMDKAFKALPPDQAKRVRSMKAENGWGDGPGLREETQFTYHHGVTPTPKNALGDPVTIYRPMSFLIDGNVPKEEAPVIKKRIREVHENLNEGHPFKQANYGVVTEGWHKDGWHGDRVAGTTLYKVKDRLSDHAEEDFEKIGDFPVSLGKGQRAKASGSSSAH